MIAHTRHWFAMVIVALLPLVGTSAAPAPAAPPSIPAPTPPPWTDCGNGAQCASVPVPVDYARPRGETINIALVRLPATDPARRIGSIFFNPGGPGASGTAFVRARANLIFSEAVRARFDIVGFDPRGIGTSTALQCFASTAEQVAFWSRAPRFPVTEAEERSMVTLTAEYTERCRQRGGALPTRMATELVARDLDRLRAAVGDDRLTYTGGSYGTYLGATYANLFPHRIRAMHLDSVLDPVLQSTDTVGSLRTLGLAVEDGLDGFAEACAKAGSVRCPLARPGEDGKAVRASLNRVYAAMRTTALPAPNATPPGSVTFPIGVDATLVNLYSPAGYPTLAKALADARAGDGSALLTLARAAGIADPPTDRPYNNQGEGFHGVFCADGDLPRTPEVWATLADRADREAPAFGRRWLYRGLACATWPRPVDKYVGPWSAPTAAPVLITNGTRDSATPLRSAQHLNRLMPRSVLLTVDSLGHATYGSESTCARTAIDRYLIDGVTPPPNTTCPADRSPFQPLPSLR